MQHALVNICSNFILGPQSHMYFSFLCTESGIVNDDEVKKRELKLREALENDRQFKIKEGTSVEIAQVRSFMQSWR